MKEQIYCFFFLNSKRRGCKELAGRIGGHQAHRVLSELYLRTRESVLSEAC